MHKLSSGKIITLLRVYTKFLLQKTVVNSRYS
jgi:hypothetical protein